MDYLLFLQFMWRKDFHLHRTYLLKTLQIFTYAFDWLYFTQCLTSFSSIDHLHLLYPWFLIVSSNIYEVLSINLSANLFVYGDFNVHHKPKDWLTYYSGTGRCGELCFNFSISNDFTQMVRGWVRYIFDSLFLSLTESICQIRKNVFYFT